MILLNERVFHLFYYGIQWNGTWPSHWSCAVVVAFVFSSLISEVDSIIKNSLSQSVSLTANFPSLLFSFYFYSSFCTWLYVCVCVIYCWAFHLHKINHSCCDSFNRVNFRLFSISPQVHFGQSLRSMNKYNAYNMWLRIGRILVSFSPSHLKMLFIFKSFPATHTPIHISVDLCEIHWLIDNRIVQNPFDPHLFSNLSESTID